jgi:hypothetical protein
MKTLMCVIGLLFVSLLVHAQERLTPTESCARYGKVRVTQDDQGNITHTECECSDIIKCPVVKGVQVACTAQIKRDSHGITRVWCGCPDQPEPDTCHVVVVHNATVPPKIEVPCAGDCPPDDNGEKRECTKSEAVQRVGRRADGTAFNQILLRDCKCPE